MFKYQPGIRQKIILGYFIVLVMITVFSFLISMVMGFMERKILLGEVISEFFDATLEMRRFEKNYFLYSKEADFHENLYYANKALEILERDTKGAGKIAHAVLLKDDLSVYIRLLTQYRHDHLAKAADNDLEVLRQKIRKQGKDVTTRAENISRAERGVIRDVLAGSRRFIVVAILVMTILSAIIGHVLSRSVVRPLKQLQDSMKIIAGGGFHMIVIDSRDREVVSLIEAFNRMLREREVRRKHLIQSEKLASLGTMLSGVAHELNNPLSNISTSCQILQEELGQGDIQYFGELLGQIDDQTNRARNIVRSLLDFSRERDFKKDMLPLQSLFEETIVFLKRQLSTRVDIVMEISEGITVYADKQRIQQVFLNLIKNAAEAITTNSETTDGYISITARRASANEKCLRHDGACVLGDTAVDVAIKDTGMGIESNVLPRIFDPFFTTKDVGKGSGLGLFIVHEIIEEHGGCITVDSHPQMGTTFRIRLQTEKGKTEHISG
ncbi:sensor histidine kinase [Candidatus Magnetobacterium casense]|uniref:histidine kinase n=1 Tax=Candidatus Magnetobacterium casense TaxID=1455061 RepID=A0ABS6RW88_9BACT|nr:sensor histidine kinase [Candidatus Magnetobacterium casensis]MBV6340894.1 HAMP domain-containing protein [Candidatus Magnetobacterium casensis]